MSDSFATPWTVIRQAPLSMGFSRQEYWRGLPFPSSGDLPNPQVKPISLTPPALAGGFFTTNVTWEDTIGITLAAKDLNVTFNFSLCPSEKIGHGLWITQHSLNL